MNYVESFDLFGVQAKQIPCEKGSGAPTESTVGAVGCFYMDTATGDVYKCTSAADGVYGWASDKQDCENTIKTLSNKVLSNTTAIRLLQNGDTQNTMDTQVTLVATAEVMVAFDVVFQLENQGGVTHIDWGDGSSNDVVGETKEEMRHIYSVDGEYTITFVGLTIIPLAFKEKNICNVVIGSTVEKIRTFAFSGNPDLTEVIIYATTPPEIYDVGLGSYKPFYGCSVTKIYVPAESILSYSHAIGWSSEYAYALHAIGAISTDIVADKIVTVGDNGDFATINDALAYLSMYYPVYKATGIKCEIQILDGTIINEQIWVERIDLSYITITSANADNTVQVDVTGWTGVTHDTRGNKPFFSGENGARLPCIRCLFSCIVPDGGWIADSEANDTNNIAVGYFCNRGSTGVVAGSADNNGVIANVGFENFYDNIIANNNSEIVVRESIARNAGRYGIMSRHISRISARSADITNCADVAAYADRASMLDVRCADLSGSDVGVNAQHASIITANEAILNDITSLVATAVYGSTVNCQGVSCDTIFAGFSVSFGGTIIANDAAITNSTGVLYNIDTNTLTASGVIYA